MQTIQGTKLSTVSTDKIGIRIRTDAVFFSPSLTKLGGPPQVQPVVF